MTVNTETEQQRSQLETTLGFRNVFAITMQGHANITKIGFNWASGFRGLEFMTIEQLHGIRNS